MAYNGFLYGVQGKYGAMLNGAFMERTTSSYVHKLFTKTSMLSPSYLWLIDDNTPQVSVSIERTTRALF